MSIESDVIAYNALQRERDDWKAANEKLAKYADSIAVERNEWKARAELAETTCGDAKFQNERLVDRQKALEEALRAAMRLATIFRKKVMPMSLGEDSYSEWERAKKELDEMEKALGEGK